MLCCIRGFALYISKRMHDSFEIKPYSFRLSWGLISHLDSESSKLVP